MKNKKTKNEILELRKQNCDLEIENKNLKFQKQFLIKQLNEAINENLKIEDEIAKLILYKINIKSSIKSFILTIKEYKKYYSYLKYDLMVADLEKIINFLECWVR